MICISAIHGSCAHHLSVLHNVVIIRFDRPAQQSTPREPAGRKNTSPLHLHLTRGHMKEDERLRIETKINVGGGTA